VLRAHGLGPHLAVDVVAQPREVELHGVVVPFLRDRVVVDLAGLGIEAPIAAWYMVSNQILPS